MKIKTKIILFAIFFCEMFTLHSQNFYYENITRTDAKKLLTILYTNMKELHPNLFEYFSEAEYNKVYDELMLNFDTADYYYSNFLLSVFQEFVAFCKDGHSGVNKEQSYKPIKKNKNQSTISSLQDTDISVFPFIINIVKGKIFVNEHCFGDDTIPSKSEIVCINNQTAQEWLQEKRRRISGERDEYKDAKLCGWQIPKLLKTDSCKFGYIKYGTEDTLYKTLYCKINKNLYQGIIMKNFAPSGWFRMIDEVLPICQTEKCPC